MNNRTIHNVTIIDLLPENLKSDPDILAASQAIDTGFFEVANHAKDTIILPRIDELDSDLLDHAAYFMHVDFYDRTMDIETKRKLVKDSIYLHQIKGTPRAVELLIETLFGEGKVEEWFEYGDTPYRFRVLTTNESATQERAEEFIRALDSVINIRSHLDKVVILQTEKMDLYYGGFMHIGSSETYKQAGG